MKAVIVLVVCLVRFSGVMSTDSPQDEGGQSEQVVVRKEVGSLTSQEALSLMRALTAMHQDNSTDGFQAIAALHGLPPLCPEPSAPKYTCSVHGRSTFPPWHRLYTVQFQDALKNHGADTGIPYWDWLRPQTNLPELVTMATYHDPLTNEDHPNPFLMGSIELEETTVNTEREVVSDLLFREGRRNWFFNQAILALEQEDYCDFEVQVEILHNGVNSWVGGSKTYSLAHLDYASYDPLFYMHHSQTDRIWAIWQDLQKHRGLHHQEAHCAELQMKKPLKPFSLGSPYNLNDVTLQFSKPQDTFNYSRLGYEYDSLDFVGMSIAQLHSSLNAQKEKDRVFAGFTLEGFGDSASVRFNVCRSDDTCENAGYFTVVGGSAEMPWKFDRVYKYDITASLKDLHLRHDDPFTISVAVTSYNGTVYGGNLIPTPSVVFEKGQRDL